MGLPLPPTLSPSKADRFTRCPLSFRFAYIDKIREPSTIHQVRGTLVHKTLELLFSGSIGAERTEEKAAVLVGTAWRSIEGGPEATSLGLDEGAVLRLLAEARSLLERYFSMEEPGAVADIGRELDLRATLGRVELHGIIDRLDEQPDGTLVVVDYKTGRAPRPEHSGARLTSVHFYAYLCEQVYGRRPAEVRLLYLRDRVVVSSRPSEQSMRGLRQRTLAVWSAIERACKSEDFRPRTSPLCRSCGYRPFCPAFGGDRAAALTEPLAPGDPVPLASGGQ